MFKRIITLQQWVNFFIDIFLSVVALFIAYIVRNEFSFNPANKSLFFKNIILLICLSSVVFMILKTYVGVARQSIIQDMIKIFSAVLLINAGFVIVYFFASYFFQKSFISITTLVINGFVGFTLLLTYRIGVKQLFAYFKNLQVNTRNVVIYGTGHEGLETLRAITGDARINYNVIAFIEDSPEKAKQSIDNIPVYHFSAFSTLLQKEAPHDLIIAGDVLPERKNEIVEYCLDRNIQVSYTPGSKTWINGQLTSYQIRKIEVEELLGSMPVDMHETIIEGQVKNKRILVTGAAGSIGSGIVNLLMRFNPEMIILVDISESALYELELQLKERHRNQLFRYFVADIRNYRRMENIFRDCKPHYVYHAAAYKNIPVMEPQPYEAVATNVIGTKNLVDLSTKYSLEKFIFLSDDKVDEPASIVGATKHIAEMYIQSLSQHLNKGRKINDDNKKQHAVVKFITVRFCSVLGTSGSVANRFAAQISKGGPVTVTHPDIVRHFMTRSETCQLILETGSMDNESDLFVFKVGRAIKINELAEKMIRLSGKIPGVDIDIRYTGLRAGEQLQEEPGDRAQGLTATYNDRVLSVPQKAYFYEEVIEDINQLISLVQFAKSETEIIQLIKKIIPAYHSGHSVNGLSTENSTV